MPGEDTGDLAPTGATDETQARHAARL